MSSTSIGEVSIEEPITRGVKRPRIDSLRSIESALSSEDVSPSTSESTTRRIDGTDVEIDSPPPFTPPAVAVAPTGSTPVPPPAVAVAPTGSTPVPPPPAVVAPTASPPIPTPVSAPKTRKTKSQLWKELLFDNTWSPSLLFHDVFQFIYKPFDELNDVQTKTSLLSEKTCRFFLNHTSSQQLYLANLRFWKSIANMRVRNERMVDDLKPFIPISMQKTPRSFESWLRLFIPVVHFLDETTNLQDIFLSPDVIQGMLFKYDGMTIISRPFFEESFQLISPRIQSDSKYISFEDLKETKVFEDYSSPSTFSFRNKRLTYIAERTLFYEGVFGGSLSKHLQRLLMKDPLYTLNFFPMVQSIVPTIAIIRSMVLLGKHLGCIRVSNIVQYIPDDELVYIQVGLPLPQRMKEGKMPNENDTSAFYWHTKFPICASEVSRLKKHSTADWFLWDYSRNQIGRFTFLDIAQPDLNYLLGISEFMVDTKTKPPASVGKIQDIVLFLDDKPPGIESTGNITELGELVDENVEDYVYNQIPLIYETEEDIENHVWILWRDRVLRSLINPSSFYNQVFVDPLAFPFYFHPNGGLNVDELINPTMYDASDATKKEFVDRKIAYNVVLRNFWIDLVEQFRLDAEQMQQMDYFKEFQDANPEIAMIALNFTEVVLSLQTETQRRPLQQASSIANNKIKDVYLLEDWCQFHQFFMAALPEGKQGYNTPKQMNQHLQTKIDIYATGTILIRLLLQQAAIVGKRSLSSLLLMQLVVMVCLFPGPCNILTFESLLKNFFIGSNETESLVALRWNNLQLNVDNSSTDLLCIMYLSVLRTIQLRKGLWSKFHSILQVHNLQTIQVLSHESLFTVVPKFLRYVKPKYFKESKELLKQFIDPSKPRAATQFFQAALDQYVSSKDKFEEELSKSVAKYYAKYGKRAALPTSSSIPVHVASDDPSAFLTESERRLQASQRKKMEDFQSKDRLQSSECAPIGLEVASFQDVWKVLLFPFFYNPFRVHSKELASMYIGSKDLDNFESSEEQTNLLRLIRKSSFTIPEMNTFMDKFFHPKFMDEIGNALFSTAEEEQWFVNIKSKFDIAAKFPSSEKLKFIINILKVLGKKLQFNWTIYTLEETPTSGKQHALGERSYDYLVSDLRQTTVVTRNVSFLFANGNNTFSYLVMARDLADQPWFQWTGHQMVTNLPSKNPNRLSILLHSDRLLNEVKSFYPATCAWRINAINPSMDKGLQYDMFKILLQNIDSPEYLSFSNCFTYICKNVYFLNEEDFRMSMIKLNARLTTLIEKTSVELVNFHHHEEKMIQVLQMVLQRPVIFYIYADDSRDYYIGRYPAPVYWTNCNELAKVRKGTNKKLKFPINIVIGKDRKSILGTFFADQFYKKTAYKDRHTDNYIYIPNQRVIRKEYKFRDDFLQETSVTEFAVKWVARVIEGSTSASVVKGGGGGSTSDDDLISLESAEDFVDYEGDDTIKKKVQFTDVVQKVGNKLSKLKQNAEKSMMNEISKLMESIWDSSRLSRHNSVDEYILYRPLLQDILQNKNKSAPSSSKLQGDEEPLIRDFLLPFLKRCYDVRNMEHRMFPNCLLLVLCRWIYFVCTAPRENLLLPSYIKHFQLFVCPHDLHQQLLFAEKNIPTENRKEVENILYNEMNYGNYNMYSSTIDFQGTTWNWAEEFYRNMTILIGLRNSVSFRNKPCAVMARLVKPFLLSKYIGMENESSENFIFLEATYKLLSKQHHTLINHINSPEFHFYEKTELIILVVQLINVAVSKHCLDDGMLKLDVFIGNKWEQNRVLIDYLEKVKHVVATRASDPSEREIEIQNWLYIIEEKVFVPHFFKAMQDNVLFRQLCAKLLLSCFIDMNPSNPTTSLKDDTSTTKSSAVGVTSEEEIMKFAGRYFAVPLLIYQIETFDDFYARADKKAPIVQSRELQTFEWNVQEILKNKPYYTKPMNRLYSFGIYKKNNNISIESIDEYPEDREIRESQRIGLYGSNPIIHPSIIAFRRIVSDESDSTSIDQQNIEPQNIKIARNDTNNTLQLVVDVITYIPYEEYANLNNSLTEPLIRIYREHKNSIRQTRSAFYNDPLFASWSKPVRKNLPFFENLTWLQCLSLLNNPIYVDEETFESYIDTSPLSKYKHVPVDIVLLGQFLIKAINDPDVFFQRIDTNNAPRMELLILKREVSDWLFMLLTNEYQFGRAKQYDVKDINLNNTLIDMWKKSQTAALHVYLQHLNENKVKQFAAKVFEEWNNDLSYVYRYIAYLISFKRNAKVLTRLVGIDARFYNPNGAAKNPFEWLFSIYLEYTKGISASRVLKKEESVEDENASVASTSSKVENSAAFAESEYYIIDIPDAVDAKELFDNSIKTPLPVTTDFVKVYTELQKKLTERDLNEAIFPVSNETFRFALFKYITLQHVLRILTMSEKWMIPANIGLTLKTYNQLPNIQYLLGICFGTSVETDASSYFKSLAESFYQQQTKGNANIDNDIKKQNYFLYQYAYTIRYYRQKWNDIKLKVPEEDSKDASWGWRTMVSKLNPPARSDAAATNPIDDASPLAKKLVLQDFAQLNNPVVESFYKRDEELLVFESVLTKYFTTEEVQKYITQFRFDDVIDSSELWKRLILPFATDLDRYFVPVDISAIINYVKAFTENLTFKKYAVQQLAKITKTKIEDAKANTDELLTTLAVKAKEQFGNVFTKMLQNPAIKTTATEPISEENRKLILDLENAAQRTRILQKQQQQSALASSKVISGFEIYNDNDGNYQDDEEDDDDIDMLLRGLAIKTTMAEDVRENSKEWRERKEKEWTELMKIKLDKRNQIITDLSTNK